MRSLNSIRRMNLLLSITIGFIAILSQRKKESVLVLLILKTSKRIYDIPEFDYYALADGIYTILQKTKTSIKKFINSRFKKKESQQLTIADAFI